MMRDSRLTRRRLGTTALATACLTAALTACGGGSGAGGSGGGGAGASNDPYKIGAALALTGPAGSFGSDALDGVKARVNAVNAAGGVGGRQIQLVVEDTKTDPTEAARVATKLVREDKVLAMFAGTTSSDALALLPQATREGVAVFVHGSAQDLTNREKPWFPLTFRIVQPVTVDAEFVRDRLKADGHKSVGVLFQEDANGVAGTEHFKKVVGDAGGVQLVDSASAAPAATDVSAQVSKVLGTKPDAVFLNMSAIGLAAAALRALDNAGYEGAVYATAGVVQQQLLTTAGGAAEGLVAGALINPNDPEATPELAALMKPAGGIESFGHFAGAQGVDVLIKGLESKPTDGKALAKAIEGAGDIKGFGQAPVRYTAEEHDGVTADGMVVVKVTGGKFVSSS